MDKINTASQMNTNNLSDTTIVISFINWIVGPYQDEDDLIIQKRVASNFSSRIIESIDRMHFSNVKDYLRTVIGHLRNIEDSWLEQEIGMTSSVNSNVSMQVRQELSREFRTLREFYLKKAKQFNEDNVME